MDNVFFGSGVAGFHKDRGIAEEIDRLDLKGYSTFTSKDHY